MINFIGRKFALYLFCIFCLYTLASSVEVHAKKVNIDKEEHKVLFISGYTNQLRRPFVDEEATIDAAGDWQEFINFLTTSPSDLGVTTGYLVENLALTPDDILIFSYSSQYDGSYRKPIYKSKHTEPCPSRSKGGNCPEKDGTTEWDKWAEHINFLLDQYPNAHFDLIGHSNGGAVAAYWAAREKANGNNDRLHRVNSVITLNSPLNGSIKICGWITRKLYSDSARDIIKMGPVAVPVYTISDKEDSVVPISESTLVEVWNKTVQAFEGSNVDCKHRRIRLNRKVMSLAIEAINAGEILKPFSVSGYTSHIIALAGKATDPLLRLRPDIEIIKPGYTTETKPILQVLIENNLTSASITPAPSYNIESLRYSFPYKPPSQPHDGLYDLHIASSGNHLPTDSLMSNSILYTDKPVGLDVVLILDRSGSMVFPTPQKFQDTKDAAKLFIDLMSETDTLGIVSFESTAAPLPGFSQLQPLNANTREAAKGAVQNLSVAGTTALGSGLEEAVKILNRSNSSGRRVFVLLTDGGENTYKCWQPVGTNPSQVSDVERQVLQSGAIIYTVALGQLSSPDEDCAQGDPHARLLDIAKNTDGEYTKAQNSNDLLGVFNRIYNSVANRQPVVDIHLNMQPGGTHKESIQVLPGTSELAFFIGFSRSVQTLVTSVNSPSGPLSSSAPNVYITSGSNYLIYNIAAPESGLWEFTVYNSISQLSSADGNNGIPIDIGINVIDGLYINSDVDNPTREYKIYDPLGLRVVIQDTSGPITNADVIATVTIPVISTSAANLKLDKLELYGEASSTQIAQQYVMAETQKLDMRLFDDGAHDDSEADDGIYGAKFNDTVISGSYIFDIIAKGTTKSGISFQRQDQTSVVVTEYETGENLPADLSVMVTKSDTTVVAPSTRLNYCVSYANLGPAQAKSVGVYLLLPEGSVLNTDSLGNRKEGLHSTNALWLIGDLAVGDHNSFKVEVQSPDTLLSNSFEVESGITSGINENEILVVGEQLSLDRNLKNDFSVASNETTLQLHLEPGWNLISLPIESGGIHPAGLLCNLEGDYSVVLGFDGTGLTFDPNLPGQFNTLQQLDGLHGYWIHSNRTASIALSNRLLEPQLTKYKLKRGWNLISYLPSEPRRVVDALAKIYDKVEVILGYSKGAMSYYTSLPPQLSTIGMMEPGRGYWIKMRDPAILEYTMNPSSYISGADLKQANRPQISSDVSSTNEWLNVYSTNSTYNGRPLPFGAVVTAVGEDGRPLGAVTVRENGWYGVLAVYRDDAYTSELDGARTGERISFLINGQPATITNGATPTWTANGDLMQVDLTGSGPEMDKFFYLPLVQR